jgi:hypothetical protein
MSCLTPREVKSAIQSRRMSDCIEVSRRYPNWISHMQLAAARDCYIDVLKELILMYGLDQKTREIISTMKLPGMNLL